MGKHTGEKWHVENTLAGKPYLIVADNGQRIADAYPLGGVEEICANVALMVAAPDLVAVLQSIIEWTEEPAERIPIERRELMIRNAARAALAKALGTGEEG